MSAFLPIAGSVLKGVGSLIAAGQVKRQAKDQLSDLKSQRGRALSQFGDIEDTVTTGYQDYIAQLGTLLIFLLEFLLMLLAEYLLTF